MTEPSAPQQPENVIPPKPVAPAPAPAAPVAPAPVAATPVPAAPKGNPVLDQKFTRDPNAPEMDRRSFIKWLTIGWAAFAAILAGYGTLIMRFLFPNVLFEPKQSFRAGFPNDYTVGEVSERFKDAQGVWIVRDNEKIYALSTVCTHLGCTPNWLANEGKYKCPCHGSGFYKTGINFEGPAPRPLERFKITIGDDGEMVVDKTKKFQQEKGEWTDSESFVLA